MLKKKILNTVYVLLMCLLISAYFLIQPVVVSGSSMNPTYQNRQLLIMKNTIFKNTNYKRYQVVVFRSYLDNAPYCIKRIIGLPGETVYIKENKIYINDIEIDNNGFGPMHYTGLASNPITLGENEYFVLGDNRDNSLDSRYNEVGNVLQQDIIGTIW